MAPFTTTTLLLLFTEELLATDDEDFAELEDATEQLLRSSVGAEDDEEELTTDEEDSTELDDATELLLFTEELLATEEELFSLEELTTDEEDSTELEEVTELLDPSTPALPPLRMTLEEELPGSSVGVEDDETITELLDCFASLAMTLEEDTSAGFSSPDEPFAEVLSSQATRPKASANAQVPRARKFFFMRDL